MPGANCSIYGCGTCRRSEGVGIFKIPSTKKSEWRTPFLSAIKKTRVVDTDFCNMVENNRVFACEKHFKETEIKTHHGGKMVKKILIPGAIPTLNMNGEQSTKKTEKSRLYKSIVKPDESCLYRSIVKPNESHLYRSIVKPDESHLNRSIVKPDESHLNRSIVKPEEEKVHSHYADIKDLARHLPNDYVTSSEWNNNLHSSFNPSSSSSEYNPQVHYAMPIPNMRPSPESVQQRPRPLFPMTYQSKYSELLNVIEDLGREIKPTYAGSRMAQDRLKKGIMHARELVVECLAEVEKSGRQ